MPKNKRVHQNSVRLMVCPDCGTPWRGQCPDCYSLEVSGRKPIDPYLDTINSKSM